MLGVYWTILVTSLVSMYMISDVDMDEWIIPVVSTAMFAMGYSIAGLCGCFRCICEYPALDACEACIHDQFENSTVVLDETNPLLDSDEYEHI